MKEFYDVRDTIKQVPSATIFYIVGQGGVGKTYSVKKELLLNVINNDKGFIYVKRYAAEYAANELNEVFADVIEDPEVKDALAEKFDPDARYFRLHILQNGAWFAVKGENEKTGKLTLIRKIGRIAAISQAQRFKGAAYNMAFNMIMFDEFISPGRGYVTGDNEPGEFDKIIGTVAREDNPVKIFMCANPDAPIEACPYLYPLKLDYANLQENTVYKFDTITPDGHRIADNVVFIKLANYAGNTYINKKAGFLFGTSAERVRMSGEVLTYEYIHLDYKERFKPEYELIVETPKITDTEYHVRIYAYVGFVDNKEPALVICKHRRFKVRNILYCRYDRNDYRKRDELQTYRLNIPPHEQYAGLVKMMHYIDASQIIITEDDQAATLYEHIRNS